MVKLKELEELQKALDEAKKIQEDHFETVYNGISIGREKETTTRTKRIEVAKKLKEAKALIEQQAAKFISIIKENDTDQSAPTPNTSLQEVENLQEVLEATIKTQQDNFVIAQGFFEKDKGVTIELFLKKVEKLETAQANIAKCVRKLATIAKESISTNKEPAPAHTVQEEKRAAAPIIQKAEPAQIPVAQTKEYVQALEAQAIKYAQTLETQAKEYVQALEAQAKAYVQMLEAKDKAHEQALAEKTSARKMTKITSFLTGGILSTLGFLFYSNCDNISQFLSTKTNAAFQAISGFVTNTALPFITSNYNAMNNAIDSLNPYARSAKMAAGALVGLFILSRKSKTGVVYAATVGAMNAPELVKLTTDIVGRYAPGMSARVLSSAVTTIGPLATGATIVGGTAAVALITGKVTKGTFSFVKNSFSSNTLAAAK